MRKQFLEAGKIINTHGIRGEVKIEPMDGRAGVFPVQNQNFIYRRQFPLKSSSARVHKSFVIASLEGVGRYGLGPEAEKQACFYKQGRCCLLRTGPSSFRTLLVLKLLTAETGDEIGTLY